MECSLYDLECIMELEEENPDAFAKALTDFGLVDAEELNDKVSKVMDIVCEYNSFNKLKLGCDFD